MIRNGLPSVVPNLPQKSHKKGSVIAFKCPVASKKMFCLLTVPWGLQMKQSSPFYPYITSSNHTHLPPSTHDYGTLWPHWTTLLPSGGRLTRWHKTKRAPWTFQSKYIYYSQINVSGSGKNEPGFILLPLPTCLWALFTYHVSILKYTTDRQETMAASLCFFPSPQKPTRTFF